MDITGLLTFNGVTGNAWTDFCTTITGGAGLCDGNDATGAGAVFAWTPTTNFGQLANSTTTQLWLKGFPISLSASSTAIFAYASTTQLTLLGTTYDSTNTAGTNGQVLAISNGLPVWSATATAITSLNGLTGATQTFTTTNGLISINSSGTAHDFNGSTTPTFGWLNATSTTATSTFPLLTAGSAFRLGSDYIQDITGDSLQITGGNTLDTIQDIHLFFN